MVSLSPDGPPKRAELEHANPFASPTAPLDYSEPVPLTTEASSTPQRASHLVPAELIPRAVAFCVDCIFFAFLIVCCYCLLGGTRAVIDMLRAEIGGVLAVSLALAFCIAQLFFFIWYWEVELLRSGKGTPGKNLSSIRVVNLMGNPPSTGQVWLRMAVKYLSAACLPFVSPILWPLIALPVIISPGRHAIHDLVANTLVIDIHKSRKLPLQPDQ